MEGKHSFLIRTREGYLRKGWPSNNGKGRKGKTVETFVVGGRVNYEGKKASALGVAGISNA